MQGIMSSGRGHLKILENRENHGAMQSHHLNVPNLLTSCNGADQIRELRVRDSEPVVRYGSLLLRHGRSSISEEECEFG